MTTAYSYDRSKNAAAMQSWGATMFDWMADLADATIRQMHASLGGQMTGAKKLTGSGFGVYATIDDAAFPGDLTGTVQLSVSWEPKGGIYFRVWAHHPQRGSIDLLKTTLGYSDRPDGIIDNALKSLKAI